MKLIAARIDEGTIPDLKMKCKRFALSEQTNQPLLPEHHNAVIMVLHLYSTPLFCCFSQLRSGSLLIFPVIFQVLFHDITP